MSDLPANIRRKGDRFQAYGRRGGKKVYVGTYDSIDEATHALAAHQASIQHREARNRQAEGELVALRVYAVAANGAEIHVGNLTVDRDVVLLDVDPRGPWVGTAEPQLESTQSSASIEVIDETEGVPF